MKFIYPLASIIFTVIIAAFFQSAQALDLFLALFSSRYVTDSICEPILPIFRSLPYCKNNYARGLLISAGVSAIAEAVTVRIDGRSSGSGVMINR